MNKLFIFSFLIILLTLFSCKSSKDLIYLKDASNNEFIKGLPVEYTLKPGDILYVSIKTSNPEVNAIYNPESGMEGSSQYGGYGYQKYSSPSGAYLYGFEIADDGTINLPMLGKIKVSAVTLEQVEAVVQKKADEYLKDAIVKVKILNFKVTVTGEVRNPGVYYNYDNSMTVIEAIAMANGNTDFAALGQVMVVRPLAGGDKTYMIDLSTKKAYLSEAFYLQPNDYVIVRPDKHKNLQLNSQAYSLVLSSLSVLIAVLGFVLPKL